jgi:Mn2+/Fe2+ NRAMP family transporter
MDGRPQLPNSFTSWVRVFGPGAIIASLTIGTGELIFSTRGGALFGYHVLFVFAVILLLKWGLVLATSRHMILTGVHPYERMIDLPGPRGWLPIALVLMAVVCMPIWISFHSGVLGNLTSWITGTSDVLHGGMDYVWGASILLATLLLSATGGYKVLENVQMAVVFALVICAIATLVLYKPDWLELLSGLLPAKLDYPDWLPQKYPEISRHSVWVETTRYVGVIGGAGFDYLAYTSWLREKSWGVLPQRATPEQLAEIAADSNHEVRKWINAPLIDSAISFGLVVAFSAVFVVSGAMFLGPEHVVPDEDSMLNLQARFVTRIQPLLLPLYVLGAFLTMIGTLYGTIEIACIIPNEIFRSFIADWSEERSKRLRRAVLGWCAPVALAILAWLFVRQASPVEFPEEAVIGMRAVVSDAEGGNAEPSRLQKPRLLLAILTPVNLFTGVLSCGLVCLLVIWMDRRWLPPGLQPPKWLVGLNLISAPAFLGLGLKGFWDNENRWVVIGAMAGIFALALLVAVAMGPKLNEMQAHRTDTA